jgi:7-carboxy-7-deazaguanine synthase
VVLTGGEPLLQVDAALIDALHAQGFMIAVETNGTIEAPAGLDWICVSPKAGSTLVQKRGHELKVVVPQSGFSVADLKAMEALDFEQRRVQAMDSAQPVARRDAMAWAVQWCLDNPRWMLSVQTHKTLGIR